MYADDWFGTPQDPELEKLVFWAILGVLVVLLLGKTAWLL